MLSLPPSPNDSFLRTPIPLIAEINPSKPAWDLEAQRSERALLASPTFDDPTWLVKMAEVHRDRGRLKMAHNVANQALDAANKAGNLLDRTRAVAVKSSIQVIEGNFTSARVHLNEIRPLLVASSGLLAHAIYEEALGNLLLRMIGSTLFEFEEAGERFAKALANYKEIGDSGGQLRTMSGMASIYSGRGQYFNAIEQIDEALKLASEKQNWKYLGLLLGSSAFAMRDQGYRHKIAELFNLAIDWATYVGDIPTRIRCVGGLANLERMEFVPPDPDSLDRTVAKLCQAIWEAKEIGAGPMMLEMQLNLATTFRKAGDPESLWKCRVLEEQITASEPFEGAHRLIHWNDFIAERLEVARDERLVTRFQEAIEGSEEPFFVFDPRQGSDASHFDLLNEFRNSAANRLLGIDTDTVRLLTDLAGTPEFQGLQEPLMQAAIDRETYTDEIALTREDAPTVYYTRRVAPAGSGAVVTFRDVTMTHQIEDALRSAADRALEADRAKSEFLANMSHEVRTPINGVLGLAQLLRDLELPPVAHRYVDGILSSGNILLKLIGDVLDLSKIEARKLEIDPRPLQIESIIKEVVGLFSGQAATSKIGLHYQIADDVPAVVILDVASLRQVLANLVGNAVKFTRVGEVLVKVTKVEAMLHFEVRDSGIGIQSSQFNAIFEPFKQVASTSDYGGSGLGLTISKRLVELMGGTIGVASQYGKGSCFFFDLPLKHGIVDNRTDGNPTVEEWIRFDGKKVLLVDDNEVNTLVAEGMLERLGCDVICAENGEIAVQRVQGARFDAVLMDVRMPVMDGLAATRAIRIMESETHRHTPIIALTAGALAQERDACFDAGMDDYLVKPFTLKSLRETLYKAFDEFPQK